MVRNFYFKDREGQTPLTEDQYRGLIPSHIQTMADLDEYEEANITKGLVWLDKQKDKNYLKYEFWLKLHKELFSEVWKWAGKIRENELSNPYFIHPTRIWTEIGNLETSILSWLEHESYSNKETAARIHERLLTIHPFPNGNGRFSRILTEHICTHLKWPKPTWSKNIPDPKERRSEYIASIDEVRQTRNYSRLEKFIFS